jgi:hypothetical protein
MVIHPTHFEPEDGKAASETSEILKPQRAKAQEQNQLELITVKP